MAEYFPLLERAVAGLKDQTPEARKVLYDRARAALLGQLRTIDPPVPEEDIQRESVALDEAISRVEAGLRTSQTQPSPAPLAVPAGRPPAPPPPAPAALPATSQAASGAEGAVPAPAPPPAQVRPPAPVRSAPPPRPSTSERVPAPSPESAKPAASAPAPARERPAYPFRNIEAGAARGAPSPMRPGTPVAPGLRDGAGARIAPDRTPGFAPRIGPAARLVEPGTRDADAPGAAPAIMPAGPPSLSSIADADQVPAADATISPEPRVSPDPRPDDLGRPRKRDRDPVGVRPAAPVPSTRERRGVGFYVALCGAGVMVAAIAVAAYVLRDRPERVIAVRPEVTADQSPGKVVNRADAPADESRPEQQSPDTPATTNPPAAGAAQPDPGNEGTSVPAPIAQGSERAVSGPAAALSSPAPATPADAPPSEPPAQPDVGSSAGPAIGVSQRAGLLVDAPDDPQKVKTYQGSVVWRSDSVSAGQGQPLSNAVSADIDIPDAKVSLSMVLKKNFEPQFPASHTIEFHFAERPGNTLGPVKQINVPEMRKDDAAASGEPLIGVPVAITDDYFLVGLSRGAAELTNEARLSQRNWVDLSILLSSGKIAKITFEKGPTGQKIIDDAIASWKSGQ